jgi:hypothetical protein
MFHSLPLGRKNERLCRGVLIDGDRAIKWREDSIASSSEKSVCCNVFHIIFRPHPNLCYVQQGTLSFMSRHLIRALELGHNALHTPVDDLESFLWVLVWSVTHILKWAAGVKMTNENSIINQLAKCLSSRYVREIHAREDTLAYEWEEKVFGGLLRDWLYISQRSRIKLNDLQDTLLLQDSLGNVAAREQSLNCIEEHCVGVYKDFMKAGYKHYQTIRLCEDWTKVVDLNVGLLNR